MLNVKRSVVHGAIKHGTLGLRAVQAWSRGVGLSASALDALSKGRCRSCSAVV